MTKAKLPKVDDLAPTPPEQTLAAVIAASQLPTEPTLPGFEMVDDDTELTPIIDPNLPLVSRPAMQADGPLAQPLTMAKQPDALKPFVPSPYIKPSTPLHYESRIEVLEAFRYGGTLLNAPDWIDRNWTGYADADAASGRPAGPVLRVPQDGGEVLCRVGDYVVKQSVRGEDQARIKTEVWAGPEFERIFTSTPAAKSGTSPDDAAAA